MAQAFYEGEIKTRPGLYQRQSNVGGVMVAGASVGIGAIIIKAEWGEPEKVYTFSGQTAANDIKKTFGTGLDVPSALAMLSGGLSILRVVRTASTSGAKGTVTLDTALTLTAKYDGAYPLNVTVRDSLTETDKKEVILMSGSTVLEKFIADGKAGAIATAINGNSEYITATATTDNTSVSNVANSLFVGGANGTVSTSDYESAITKLENYKYDGIVVATHDTAVHTYLSEYLNNVEASGKRAYGVVGGYTDLVLTTRMTNAQAFDTEHMIYCGSGYIDGDGNAVGKINGDTVAMAKQAGYIIACPSNSSVVHQEIAGATGLVEELTNEQYTAAINSGMLMLSRSSTDSIWFDSGVNTLRNPSDDQDEGWKKIKRVKIRYELFDRMDRSLEPLCGKIDCDPDGVGLVVQYGQKVINQMIAERKLLSGTITVDKYDTDSGWFNIEVVDRDTLEKIYLHYMFRYSTNIA